MFKKYILFTVLFSLFFNIESKGQCSDSIISNVSCYTIGTNPIFSTLNGTMGAWWIYDASGNLMYSYIPGQFGTPPPINSINYSFLTQGEYLIEMSTGGWTPCDYQLTIYVTNQSLDLSLSTNSTTICSGGSIDYSSLGINITNVTGNVTYYWELPNGQSWTGLTPFPIPTGQNNVILTITDDATGCSDSATISLSYQSTNANASFVSSVNTVSCPGESVIFTANNINTSLYSYSWMIDGVLQSGGVNGILTSNILPNASNVMYLYLLRIIVMDVLYKQLIH